MRAVFETAFDVVYLITVIAVGITMIAKSLNRWNRIDGAYPQIVDKVTQDSL